MFGGLDEREIPIVRRIADLERIPWLRTAALVGTRAGDGWGLLAIIPCALALGGQRGLAAVGCGIVSGAIVGALVQGVKHVVRRQRPPVEVTRPIGAPDRYAFPSGHTAQAFSTLACGFWIAPHVGFLFLPLALLIATSRIVFGLHWPSDVLAGACIGSLVALVTLHLGEANGLVAWLQSWWPAAS